MSKAKISKELAGRIIKVNPHLSETERNYLITNGGVLDTKLDNILKHTPDLSDDDIKIIKNNVHIKNLRGPHPKHEGEERKQLVEKILQKFYDAFPHTNPDNQDVENLDSSNDLEEK